jgi:hypothetical protein
MKIFLLPGVNTHFQQALKQAVFQARFLKISHRTEKADVIIGRRFIGLFSHHSASGKASLMETVPENIF